MGKSAEKVTLRGAVTFGLQWQLCSQFQGNSTGRKQGRIGLDLTVLLPSDPLQGLLLGQIQLGTRDEMNLLKAFTQVKVLQVSPGHRTRHRRAKNGCRVRTKASGSVNRAHAVPHGCFYPTWYCLLPH